MEKLIVAAGAKVLEEYFQVLVNDGLLDMGTVTPWDCSFLAEKIYGEMSKVAVKESAI
jgi:hypothetical protein